MKTISISMVGRTMANTEYDSEKIQILKILYYNNTNNSVQYFIYLRAYATNKDKTRQLGQ
jgi:hypothetical protein